MKILDKFDKELIDGSVIDIHQTVNGQNLFIVLSVADLDIRYRHDINRKYEYDKQEILSRNRFNGEIEFEIIDNMRNTCLTSLDISNFDDKKLKSVYKEIHFSKSLSLSEIRSCKDISDDLKHLFGLQDARYKYSHLTGLHMRIHELLVEEIVNRYLDME